MRCDEAARFARSIAGDDRLHDDTHVFAVKQESEIKEAEYYLQNVLFYSADVIRSSKSLLALRHVNIFIAHVSSI